ncbi:MAG: LysR family transcriptional regulator [bacterium]|nr:LysR family transcriptional regulator [bacterium]
MIIELQRFIFVIEEGSFTRASKKLFLTQPALSLSILRLEKEIGVKLFKRSGKTFVLTKSGQGIYQIAIQILKLWDRIKENPSNLGGKIPLYSIGLYDNAALKLSKYFKQSFLKKDFSFEITIDGSRNLLQGIQNGIFDICICILSPDFYFKNALLIKTFSENLLPVSSKKFNKSFSNIPFILYNKGSATRDSIDKVFLKNTIKPKILVESTNPGFMKELALWGCGVALLPKNFVKRELDQKKLIAQKFPFLFQREVGIYLNKDSVIKKDDLIIQRIIANLKEN